MKPLCCHLRIPETTRALLWDMDGVLLDSLGLDLQLSVALFSRTLQKPVTLSADFIRGIFAYDPARFVEKIFDQLEAEHGKFASRTRVSPGLLEEYLHLRRTSLIPLLPGVTEALGAAQKLGLRQAVVSNNPQFEVEAILKTAGLEKSFAALIGNDLTIHGKALRKKPAPDFYLHGCERLGASPQQAVVFEDSTLGASAGLAAGCHVIALLTGSAGIAELRALSPAPHQVFSNLLSEAAQ
ncbi:MAG: HAD family phosphatase [Proteobacteria bacterium]|nr:HAD family phosphatase [Pseudomonadota bacterium]